MNNEPYPSVLIPGSPGQGGDKDLLRTSSLPSGINMVGNPVQLRLTTSHGHKKAQFWRNSVAVTNSDYYNQWRPQISSLVKVHGSGAIRPIPSAPSLDTISEYEMRELHDDDSQDQYKLPHAYGKRPSHNREPVADPNMFRYTPTPILDPQRQTVPTPLSRPTTPQVGSAGFAQTRSQPEMSPFPMTALSPSGSSFLRGSSQAIHVTAAATNQFVPIFLNPETGNVYMFEEGFYVPLSSKNVKELEKTTKIDTLTKPPTPNRRSIPLPKPAPDCFLFVVVLAIISCLCLNIPVFLIFLLPSLVCSYKVRQYNSLGISDRGKTCFEWSACSSISAILFLLLSFFAVVAAVTILILTFAVNVI